MKVEFWADTHEGRVRDHNEDNFLVDAGRGLFVVCDGMGGHAAGEVASALSAETIRRTIDENASVLDDLTDNPHGTEEAEAVLEVLEGAIQRASERVCDAAREDEQFRGMGTTCSLLLLHAGRAFVGHVGDSRIYRARDGAVEQVTEDHSLLNEMIRRGQAKQGDSIPNKNAVTRAVGVQRHIDVDTFEADVREGDLFLMCSDGLSEYLEDRTHLSELLDGERLDTMVEACIDHALEGGGQDNVTAIVARAVDGENAEGARPDHRLARLFEESSVFSHVTASEVVRLARIARWRVLSAGDTIGEERALHLVADGVVRPVGKGGGEELLSRGAIFGARGLFGEAAAMKTFEALEPTEVVVFEHGPLYDLLGSMPGLSARVMYGLAARFERRLGDRQTADDSPPSLPESADEPKPTLTPGADVVHEPASIKGGLGEASSTGGEVVGESSDEGDKQTTAELEKMRKTVQLDKFERDDTDEKGET